MSLEPPLISIVTPCLNAASVIRDAVESVAQTSAVGVEHIVVDGGSTDGTREILQEYDHLKLIFESDNGPYDALNTGFRCANGKILAWLNADDFYLPHALDAVAEIFDQFAEINWLTTTFPLFANASGLIVGATPVSGYSAHRAIRPDSARFTSQIHTVLQQESTFWTRALWEASGAQLDTQYKYAADFELWLRFWQRSELCAANTPLGCFRWSSEQRSRTYQLAYRKEVDDILEIYGGRRAGVLRTIGRRAALALRGLPQNILKYFPFSVAQATASYNRESNQWELGSHISVLP